ncbi:hypothetical protein [Cognatishimia sp. F0-27]|uniref:hypothetical protein n=1 Tax=Cognatishimia sp. F0-27 TaxID=2816855 RepID=UPI001D0C7CAE|nr:hypothetical protein [Cognatishimia sp. F0-27]MCC1492485.1 hypothetical protein [Cognatishimia sp. F0-27]
MKILQIGTIFLVTSVHSASNPVNPGSESCFADLTFERGDKTDPETFSQSIDLGGNTPGTVSFDCRFLAHTSFDVAVEPRLGTMSVKEPVLFAIDAPRVVETGARIIMDATPVRRDSGPRHLNGNTMIFLNPARLSNSGPPSTMQAIHQSLHSI